MSKLGFLNTGGEYPRITKKLYLKGYDAAFKDDYLEIWLNWSRDFNEAMLDGNKELARVMALQADTPELQARQDEAFDGWLPGSFERYAEYWGCTPEQAEQIYRVDIELWNWIREKADALRVEFQTRRKN